MISSTDMADQWMKLINKNPAEIEVEHEPWDHSNVVFVKDLKKKGTLSYEEAESTKIIDLIKQNKLDELKVELEISKTSIICLKEGHEVIYYQWDSFTGNFENVATTEIQYHLPIHIACRENSVDIVKYLLGREETKEFINTYSSSTENKDKMTPLLIVTRNLNLELTKLLIEYCDPSDLSLKTFFGTNLLQVATDSLSGIISRIRSEYRKKRKDRQELLRDVTTHELERQRMEKEEDERQLDLERKDKERETDKLIILLSYLLSLKSPNLEINSRAVHTFGSSSSGFGHSTTRKFKLDSTIFHRAIKSDNIKLIEFLLSQGADIHMKAEEERYSVVHLVTSVEALNLLISHGANILAKTKAVVNWAGNVDVPLTAIEYLQKKQRIHEEDEALLEPVVQALKTATRQLQEHCSSLVNNWEKVMIFKYFDSPLHPELIQEIIVLLYECGRKRNVR